MIRPKLRFEWRDGTSGHIDIPDALADFMPSSAVVFCQILATLFDCGLPVDISVLMGVVACDRFVWHAINGFDRT